MLKRIWNFKIGYLLLTLLLSLTVQSLSAAPETGRSKIWLEELDLSKMTCGFKTPKAAKSIRDTQLTINEVAYIHGVGTHADSAFVIDLNGSALAFTASVGVDDTAYGWGTVRFRILVDGKLAADSNVMRSNQYAKRLKVDLAGAKKMTLLVDGLKDGQATDLANWADASITLAPNASTLPQAEAVTPEALVITGAAAPLQESVPAGGVLWLETLDLSRFDQQWKWPVISGSVEGHAMTMNGVVYQHGIGTRPRSEFPIYLKKRARLFSAKVGVDDDAGTKGSVVFQVWVDGRKAADTGIMRGGDKPQELSIDLVGAEQMLLLVDGADDGYYMDNADLADASITLAEGETSLPGLQDIQADPPVAIASSEHGDKPVIHNPRVVGATPGRPFLFMLPATGKQPLTYSAKNLPAGLSLDPATGIITGSLASAGETAVMLSVKGPAGTVEQELKIVGGDRKLALTPPMGWNSWYVWEANVTETNMRDAADWLARKGLAAHGYQYVNIDEGWAGKRNAYGEIQPNEKFKSIKALADYVHAKGFKFGIYSSPGPRTCGENQGSYQYEEIDAKTYAKWGVDLLKYDWCSYGEVAKGEGLEYFQRPYRVMMEALDKTDRDMVYCMCQYGMGDVWKWGKEIGANMWRTNNDINDRWNSMAAVAFTETGHEAYSGPGHWNDPDILLFGKVGCYRGLHQTRLTPHEQVSIFTLWSLLASPLYFGGDPQQLDQFTLDILRNDEVLDVNQDPLGQQARRISRDGLTEVWARPLNDGTLAVGLFNRGPFNSAVTAKWLDLGLAGEQPVRDLWLKKDLGKIKDFFSATIPAHGTVLLKVGKKTL